MKNNWLKLYHEILSDPKMGTMSDHLFRRTIELFLLAGSEGKDGLLPEVNGIAWALHTTPKDIQTVISQLKKLNIIEDYFDPVSLISGTELPKRYVVKHFAIRQKSEQTKSESNRAYYEKKRLNKTEIQTENSETDTEIQTEIQFVDKERDKDIDKDKEKIKKEIKKEREIKNEIQSEIQTETLPPSKPQKHRHGNFQHVLLTDEEFQRLQNDIGQDRTAEYIQKLDDYLENNPSKHYANHNLTIRNWLNKDTQKPQTTFVKTQAKEETWLEVAQRIQAERNAQKDVIDL